MSGERALPAPAGARVASGRLRVDAARAVDKLRGYQLPDPTMWVLEVVRAATLAGATRIRAYGDADDVVVAWEGEPIGGEDLAKLLDELVDPAPSPERRHLRLLATGVNTALGLDPRWVDVTSTDGASGALAVRYTPRLLERGEDGAARGLRELSAQERVPGPLAPPRGVMVHVRRLPLLGALPILIGIGEPAELSVVRRACADVRVPLGIGRAELGRDRSHGDLLRLALREGLDGFFALVDPSVASGEPRLEVAELGVLLARYTLPIEGLEVPRAKVPLRLFVDAPRMPTNASRSAVRVDEPPVRDALEAAPELLEALVERLARELSGEGAHAWSPSQRERLHAAALSLLAAAVAGADWRASLAGLARRGAYGAAVARLAALPLVRDALGRPRAPSSFALRLGAEHVHVAMDPVSEDLEAWLGEVLWIPPGDPASVLLGDWRAPTTKALLSRVRGHRGARERWRRERPRPPAVQDGPGQLLSVPVAAPGKSLKSCISPEAFRRAEGVTGELVLRDPRSVRASTIVMRLEGRELERLSIDLPIAVLAEVEHPALRPTPDYRGAEHDEVFEAVIEAVRAAAVVACEALALRLELRAKKGDRATVRAAWIAEGRADDRAVLAGVVRGGIELAAARGGAAAHALRDGKSPLLEAEVWPLAGGGWRSLREILAEASRPPRALAFVHHDPGLPAREGARAVHLLSRREQSTIEALVAPAVLADYGPAFVGPERPVRDLVRAVLPPDGAALRVRGDRFSAVVAWAGGAHELEVRHWGKVFSRAPLAPELGALRVVVEDERVVPDLSWRAIRVAAPEPYALADWRLALCRAFADALIGEPPRELTVGASGARAATAARQAFFRVIAEEEAPPAELLGAKRAKALASAPFVWVLGEAEPVSLSDVASRFPRGRIPWIPHHVSLSFDAGDWHPVRADANEAAAYARLIGRDFEQADDEIDRRRRAAAREVALHRHRLGPEEDPARHWSPSVVLAGTGFRSGAVTLATRADVGAEILVSIEGRRFATLERQDQLPVRLAIDFGEAAADEDFRGLTAAAQRTITHGILRGGRALLRKLAREDPGALVGSPRAHALLCAWAERIGERESERKLADRLIGVPAFPAVRGGVVSLESASTDNGALRVALWDEPWLAPVEGERESAHDRPVIRLPSDEQARAVMTALLERLWRRGPVRDVSGAVARLQTERRIARGLAEAPRLSEVRDPRFRYALDDLLADDHEAAELLGVGEAALDEGDASRVMIFAGGVPWQTIELNLIPRVTVAASVPLARPGRPIDKRTRDGLHDALRSVTSRLMRRVVDETPADQLPEWVRRALRASCLHGGETHYERLATTPMFETTAGAWVSPSELRAQAERFGSVWWTADVDSRALPLDEARIALRLPAAQAALLAAWIELTEADAELRLDARARMNRDRPPVETLEPTAAERALGASVIALEPEEDDPTHGSVVVLSPEHAAARALHVHRAMHPLGTLEDPSYWPAISRVDHPGLSPNRTWEVAEADLALARVRGRVRRAVERELVRLVPIPRKKRFTVRLRALPQRALALPQGAVLEGVAYLEDELAPGSFTIRDAAGERQVAPAHDGRALPVSGTIWIVGAQIHSGTAKIFTGTYRELLQRVAAHAERGPDALLVELAHGLGFLEAEWTPPIALPCFAPEPWTLRALVEHVQASGFVHVATPERAGGAARASEGGRVLVSDGSPLAAALVRALGTRAIEWRAALRARVLSEVPLAGGASDAAAPESPLEAAVAAALARAGVPGATRVRLARRGKALVRVDGGVVSIADRDPRLAGRDLADPRVATLIAARATGTLRRGEGRTDEFGELRAIERLLEGVATGGEGGATGE